MLFQNVRSIIRFWTTRFTYQNKFYRVLILGLDRNLSLRERGIDYMPNVYRNRCPYFASIIWWDKDLLCRKYKLSHHYSNNNDDNNNDNDKDNDNNNNSNNNNNNNNNKDDNDRKYVGI